MFIFRIIYKMRTLLKENKKGRNKKMKKSSLDITSHFTIFKNPL